ncbi:MAG: glutamate--tRNA ligase [bacterium]|nr:glutamate--tRNA ligase [bacterium]
MSSDATKIRVRFAPSPTGMLHVGTARTALFNWLFARHVGGTFVLRIEDTDKARSTVESENGLVESLRWLGLNWDEGPNNPGDCGPYRQSERLDIYRDKTRQLIDAGAAYRCFCSDEDLSAKRDAAKAAGLATHYDRTCAAIDPAEAERRAATEPHIVRFRMPLRDITIEDIIRGEVTFPADMVGDFILLRQDGMPIYNFACVVDDGLMRITHVVRGDDHLSNTLRQVVIYEALGLPVPRFAHLSMILGEDRSKLSKRHGATSVESYREQGYPADALVNYLALLGWNPGDDREDMTRAELIEAFSLERVHKSAAIFDHTKLKWLSGVKIRGAGADELLPDARRFLPDDDDERRLLMIKAVLDRIHCAAGIPDQLAALRGDLPEPDEETREWLANGELFGALAERLATPPTEDAEGAPLPPDAPLNSAEFKRAVKKTGKAVGAKGKGLFMPVRVALTGVMHGPDLSAIAELLGREVVLSRLRSAMKAE